MASFSRLKDILRSLPASPRVALLSGAGISAESGIPTFRGPEGYWRVGSREYRPQEMATLSMFNQNPWEVWSWYLYRRAVCSRAAPNPGHFAAGRIEELCGDRFRLITQNVDGLHLKAGNTEPRTFQIHGNLHFMRCARPCELKILEIPPEVQGKGKGQPLTRAEQEALVCPFCGSLTRPHVLWFDECYNEHFFRSESALQWALTTDLLFVVGTSGATTLPMHVTEIVFRKPDAALVDINTEDNPFRSLAQSHPNGVVLDGKSGEMLPAVVELLGN